MFMYEQINRNVLVKMLQWYIGINTDFTKSVGTFGKYIPHFLEEDEWNEFVSTYPNGNYENIWEALFKMCALYRKIAIKVANHFRFAYPYGDDERVTAHLQHIRKLPKNAEKMY